MLSADHLHPCSKMTTTLFYSKEKGTAKNEEVWACLKNTHPTEMILDERKWELCNYIHLP